MPTVFLHIGLMKSGTTYLQRILAKNKKSLKESGLLFPGARWRDQVAGVEEVLGARVAHHEASTAWDSLCREVLDFDGDAIISMEGMAVADASQTARIASSFHDRSVRVVATARDLARVVPAQWQESLKNGADLRFDRYLRIITAPGARRLPPAQFFWGLHDLPRILSRWRPHVDPVDLVLVTVPPSGSPPELLWQRFCEAVQLQMDDLDLTVRRNDSLGSHSAELLRRLNGLRSAGDNRAEKRTIKQLLAKQVLVAHRESEPAITLPQQYSDWASKTSRKLVKEVRGVGPEVVGSLDDLIVVQHGKGPARHSGAPPPSETELNELALNTILDLIRRVGPK